MYSCCKLLHLPEMNYLVEVDVNRLVSVRFLPSILIYPRLDGYLPSGVFFSSLFYPWGCPCLYVDFGLKYCFCFLTYARNRTQSKSEVPRFLVSSTFLGVPRCWFSVLGNKE
jgi:hypothetical protein